MRVRPVIADQWYRFDKFDGTLLAVNAKTVAEKAQAYYGHHAAEVIAFGRFDTPLDIYSRGDKLTHAERKVGDK